MASTYSTNLAIELIGTGEQSGTWGTTTNTNLGTLIEQAISGYTTYAASGSTDLLTIPNGASGTARNMFIRVTGSGGGAIEVPANNKLYFVWNNTTSGNITFRVTGQTGTVIPNNAKMLLVVGTNGTTVDARPAVDTFSSLSLGSPLTVANGGTGLATLTANNVLIGNGTSSPTFVAPGTAGNVLTSITSGASTVWSSAAVPSQLPIGGLMMWPTATAPSGWLLCNGAAYTVPVTSTDPYYALYQVIGTTFGSGTGTFKVPDYRDRMPIGAGTTYSANSSGGSKDAIVVSHTHTATDSGHSHTYGSAQGITGGAAAATQGTNSGAFSTSTGNANISVSTTGSSGTNANLPPYLGIYFIIKYA